MKITDKNQLEIKTLRNDFFLWKNSMLNEKKADFSNFEYKIDKKHELIMLNSYDRHFTFLFTFLESINSLDNILTEDFITLLDIVRKFLWEISNDFYRIHFCVEIALRLTLKEWANLSPNIYPKVFDRKILDLNKWEEFYNSPENTSDEKAFSKKMKRGVNELLLLNSIHAYDAISFCPTKINKFDYFKIQLLERKISLRWDEQKTEQDFFNLLVDVNRYRNFFLYWRNKKTDDIKTINDYIKNYLRWRNTYYNPPTPLLLNNIISNLKNSLSEKLQTHVDKLVLEFYTPAVNLGAEYINKHTHEENKRKPKEFNDTSDKGDRFRLFLDENFRKSNTEISEEEFNDFNNQRHLIDALEDRINDLFLFFDKVKQEWDKSKTFEKLRKSTFHTKLYNALKYLKKYEDKPLPSHVLFIMINIFQVLSGLSIKKCEKILEDKNVSCIIASLREIEKTRDSIYHFNTLDECSRSKFWKSVSYFQPK